MICKEDLETAANLLVARMEEKLKPRKSPEEMEVERLFFWILTRLALKMEGASSNTSCSITIKEKRSSGCLILCHGNVDQYYTNLVIQEEVYIVMQKVDDILNKLPHFHSVLLTPSKDNCELAEMTIFVFVK